MNEDIVGFDALYESMRKCILGVRWKDSVASYHLNAIENTIKLERELKFGRYKPRKTKEFTIYHPKERHIMSVAFRDRVYQRSLNDNSVYPQMVKSFIPDNYACQRGKGPDYCRERLKRFLRKHYRQCGSIGWVLQVDVHGYYPNMKHSVAEQTFHRKLDPETYSRVVDILRGQYPGDTGYNPGSQLVQIAGVAVLDKIDHFIKEVLRVKFYMRYMDDFILIHRGRKFLEECKERILEEMQALHFEPNPKKTRVYRLKEGINFLGFRYHLSDTGKVYMLIRSENVSANRRKFRRMAGLVRKGVIPREYVDKSYECWVAHASKGDTYKVRQRMEEFYRSLWRE